MKRFFTLVALSVLFFSSATAFAAVTFPINGGTGSTTLSGIISGNGTSPVNTTILGTGISFLSNTLSSIGTTTATLWVDGNRTVSNQTGTIEQPFETIANLIAGLPAALSAYAIQLSPTTYVNGAPTIFPNLPIYIAGNEATLVVPSGLTIPASFDVYDLSVVGNVSETDTSQTSIHQFNNSTIIGNTNIAGLATFMGDVVQGNTYSGAGSLTDFSGGQITGTVGSAGQLILSNSEISTTSDNTGYAITSTTTGSGVNIAGETVINTGTGGGVNVSNGATTMPNYLADLSVVTGGASITAGTAVTQLCDFNASNLSGTFVAPTGTNFIPCYDEKLNVLSNLGVGTTTPNSIFSVQGNQYTSGNAFFGGAITATSTLTLSALGTPAGAFLAVNPSGQVITTTTPSGSGGISDPFTHPSYGSATSTTIGFTGGFLDTASTTFTSSPQFNSLFAQTINPDTSAADSFNFGGRPSVGIPVPYVRPTQSNQNIALDIFPNGTPGNGFGSSLYGVAWEDICSTDIFAGPNYECLHLGKALNGASNVSSSQGGTGLIQPLELQGFGGNTGIGTSSPYGYFSITASTTAGQPNEPLFTIASSSTDVIVTNGGLFGLGTSSPISTLTVNGGVTLHGLPTGAGNGTVCATTDGLISYSTSGCTGGGSTNYFTNSGASTYLSTGTNLGIGTTSPFGLLTVADVPADVNTFPLYVSSSTAAFATTTLLSLDNLGNLTTRLGFNTSAAGSVGVGTMPVGFPLYAVKSSVGDTSIYVQNPDGALGDSSSVLLDTRATANDTSVGAKISAIRTNAITNGDNDLAFFNSSGVTMNENFIIKATGDVGIGTTTPPWKLDIATSSTGSQFNHGQLALTDTQAGTNLKHWVFSNENGNFYLSSSSDLYATSSQPLFSITPSATANATTTFSLTDFLIKQTSQTAFQIADAFGTIDALFNTASTTGSIFTVAATTSPSISAPIKLFDVDQYGHLTASSTGPAQPVISSCGTGSPTLGTNSNDTTGDITTGTSASTCTLTFARAFSATPEVFITDSNTSAVIDVSSRSTTAFTVSTASALSAVNISYLVIIP